MMLIAYPDVRKCLLDRGWREETNKNVQHVDLKFSLNSQDIMYPIMKNNCIVNHNRGEGSITCKSGLIESLSDSPDFWISWHTMNNKF